jgi:hypothetical protein
MLKRYFLIFFLFPVILFANDTTGASKFVSDLYAKYSKDDNFSPFGRKAHAYFSPSLLKLFELEAKIAVEEGEENFWITDPLCEGNDRGDVKLNNVKISQKSGKVYANVIYQNLGSKMQVILELIKIKKRWFIHDIISEGNKSLYKELSEYIKSKNPDSVKDKKSELNKEKSPKIADSTVIESIPSKGNFSDYQGKMNWKNAKKKCANLKMRLPTIKELTAAFKAKTTEAWKKEGKLYWTSEELGDDSDIKSYSYYFNVNTGTALDVTDKNNDKRVRCIR